MSAGFSDETVISKLSSLNDTTDTIVAVAQWIMFHRRQAIRSAELWQDRLRESPPHRKLNLTYLANEVVQQSKAKGKMDFVNVFSPIIADSMETAYKGTPREVQQKVRHTVQVWRQRGIFKPDILDDIECRFNAIDKAGKPLSASSGLKLGGRFGSSSTGVNSDVPLELVPLMKTQRDLKAAVSKSTVAVNSANTDFAKSFETDVLPAPPVYTARLSALIKSLDSASTAASGAVVAREAHIRNLSSLLEQSKKQLELEIETAKQMQEKRDKAEATKEDVEVKLIKELDSSIPSGDLRASTDQSATPPEVEALTPPPVSEPNDPPSAKAEHHAHTMTALGTTLPISSPPQFQTSELLATLQQTSNGGAAGIKRAREQDNVFAGIDPDLVSLFQNDGGEKKQKISDGADDEYIP